MKVLWFQLYSCHVSLSAVYESCLRALSRNLDLAGGHITLGEHVDPATKEEMALWSGGDEEGGGTGVMLSWLYETGANWCSAGTHLQSMEKYRNIELHSLGYVEQRDEAAQS